MWFVNAFGPGPLKMERTHVRPAQGCRPVNAIAQIGSGVRLLVGFAGLLVAAGLDHFDDGAVGRAEPQRRRAGLRENLAAVLLDDFAEGLAVGDFEAPVLDA